MCDVCVSLYMHLVKQLQNYIFYLDWLLKWKKNYTITQKNSYIAELLAIFVAGIIVITLSTST